MAHRRFSLSVEKEIQVKRSSLPIIIAISIAGGFGFGEYLSRPPVVKAMPMVRLTKVQEGLNTVIGDNVVGFSCNQQDCYIASTQ